MRDTGSEPAWPLAFRFLSGLNHESATADAAHLVTWSLLPVTWSQVSGPCYFLPTHYLIGTLLVLVVTSPKFHR